MTSTDGMAPVIAQHEAALDQLLTEHGCPGIPVTATYTTAELMPHYRKLKAEHCRHLSTHQG